MASFAHARDYGPNLVGAQHGSVSEYNPQEEYLLSQDGIVSYKRNMQVYQGGPYGAVPWAGVPIASQYLATY